MPDVDLDDVALGRGMTVCKPQFGGGPEAVIAEQDAEHFGLAIGKAQLVKRQVLSDGEGKAHAALRSFARLRCLERVTLAPSPSYLHSMARRSSLRSSPVIPQAARTSRISLARPSMSDSG